MKKNKMYSEVVSAMKRERQVKNNDRVALFPIVFIVLDCIIIIEIMVCIIHLILFKTIPNLHPRGFPVIYYEVFLSFGILSIAGFFVYSIPVSREHTELEIKIKVESLLKEFQSFEEANCDHYDIFKEIPVKSQEELKEAIASLKEILELRNLADGGIHLA